jgi:hypothetical protein
LRKTTLTDLPLLGYEEVVELLLQYNTHAIDQQTVHRAASHGAYGKSVLRMLQHHDKALVIDDELFLSHRPQIFPFSPPINKRSSSLPGGSTVASSDLSTMTLVTYELGKQKSPWNSQARSTCHDLRPSLALSGQNPIPKYASWDELLCTTKAGCKFCAVLQQEVRHFLQSEPCGYREISIFGGEGPMHSIHPMCVQLCNDYHGPSAALEPEVTVEF